MTAGHNLFSDPACTALQAYVSEVRRADSADSGDAVASFATNRFEQIGTTSARCCARRMNNVMAGGEEEKGCNPEKADSVQEMTPQRPTHIPSFYRSRQAAVMPHALRRQLITTPSAMLLRDRPASHATPEKSSRQRHQQKRNSDEGERIGRSHAEEQRR